MTSISFPGLGIKEFQISKIAFSVFNRNVAWYGLIICIGIILAVTYSMWRGKKSEGIKSDDIIDFGLFLTIFGVIGARLYYVAFEYDSYLVTGKGIWTDIKETFINVISIWKGGLGIYGALIAGFLTLLVVCKVKKIKITKMLDVASPACMIGQLIGRWGNFVNGEAFGSTTTLPWRMCGNGFADYLLNRRLIDSETYSKMVTGEIGVHPTFFYESLWNFIGFIIANILYRKKKFDGEIFFFYISWYGFGRMFIEGLRTDSLMAGPVRASQLVGLLAFITGVVMMIIFAVKNKNKVALADFNAPAVKEKKKKCVSEGNADNDIEETASLDDIAEKAETYDTEGEEAENGDNLDSETKSEEA